jgi:hypothetical protein
MDHQVLGVCSTLGILGGPTDEYGDWPMYGHATPDFFGSLWYSSVSLNTTQRSGNQFNPKYVEIRLLLHCRNCFHINRDGSFANQNLDVDLAFVRPYYQLERDSGSQLTECMQLSWCRPQASSSTFVVHSMPSYFLIDIKSILKVIHVVPHFGQHLYEGETFFINKWKF